jgi:hypothetical protein
MRPQLKKRTWSIYTVVQVYLSRAQQVVPPDLSLLLSSCTHPPLRLLHQMIPYLRPCSLFRQSFSTHHLLHIFIPKPHSECRSTSFGVHEEVKRHVRVGRGCLACNGNERPCGEGKVPRQCGVAYSVGFYVPGEDVGERDAWRAAGHFLGRRRGTRMLAVTMRSCGAYYLCKGVYKDRVS